MLLQSPKLKPTKLPNSSQEVEKKPFSIKDRKKSFLYAFQGIGYMVRTQHNAWIHLSLAALVIVCGVFFEVSRYEWIFLIFAIGFVLVAEAFNTAVEVLVDLVCPEFHPLAGIAKDLASGAVLLAAISSALVGLLIFIPYLYQGIVKIF